MAKSKKARVWSEAELIDAYGLTKSFDTAPLLVEWLNTSTTFEPHEHATIERIRTEAQKNMAGWSEEDLKMNFIAFIIDLAHLRTNDRFRTYYEKTVEATVGDNFLKIKTDFMVAKGILDMVKTPYFHFQEYTSTSLSTSKREKDPNGDPIAQLVEAFLIAQEKNKNGKPLYGCYVRGRSWYFVVMEGKNYCESRAFDSTQEDDLFQIIAVLRHFREILLTRLLD